jgi:hypothetical protein
MFGGTEDDDDFGHSDGAQMPWIPVRPEEVAALMGEYRRAVGAAEALAVGLLTAGLERGELPEMTATLDADGRACVLIGQLSACAARRVAVALRRAGNVA